VFRKEDWCYGTEDKIETTTFIVTGKSGLASSSFSTGFERFLWARCLSRHTTNSVKALKETKSIDINQQSGLVSSSDTGLLNDGPLLHLHWLDSKTLEQRDRNQKLKGIELTAPF